MPTPEPPPDAAETAASTVRRPTVSVVVPVRNAQERIRRCLEALVAQSYPSELFEHIIVDNGSEDGTRDVVRGFPVTLMVEDRVLGPYAARNAGIARARGEIVALTDANCTPAADWLERGVDALVAADADLVGGRVVFELSEPPSVGELVDALTNVDVEASIANHRACMTGNLFVRRSVLDRVGPFDPSVRSGGDMRWTRAATDAGFRLVYAPQAEVHYPARPLVPLLAKQLRVGRGAPGVWAAMGLRGPAMVWATLRGLLPMPPLGLGERMRRRGLTASGYRLIQVWLAGWLAKVARSVGCAWGLASSARRPARSR